MRKSLVFLVLIYSLTACQGASLMKNEKGEYSLFENQQGQIDELELVATDFKEVFIQVYNEDLKKNIHSSYPVGDLALKVGDKQQNFSVKYGSEIDFNGYHLKITWIVVGNRDFKSSIQFRIQKKVS
jgi:hypothetical protein